MRLRRFFKWTGIVLGLGLLVLIGLAVNIIWFRPFSPRIFYEKAFVEFAFKSPETLSSLRLFEQIGIHGHNGRLDDISPAQTREFSRMMKDNLKTLRSYDRESMEGQNALSYDILEYFLSEQVAGERFQWHGYPVNQLFGLQNTLPRFMTSIHHLGSVRDAEYYIARLNLFDVKFAQLVEDLELRTGKDIVPPQFVVTKVLEEIRAFRGTPAEENVLYTSFVERSGEIEDLDDATRTRLAADVAAAIESTVYPAYDTLIGFLERLDEKVDTNHGVWALPDGDAYYDYQLRQHTSTDMTADQIHDLGVAEVARIEAEMDAILRAEGYTQGTVAERITSLHEEPRFLYPNTDEGREQILADYQTLIDEINEKMPQYFGRLPRAGLVVERIPQFTEKTSPGAYYQGPSMDGSRPGKFFVNLRDMREQPRFSMRTLAYHEGVPGHHFQTALQTELTGVPQFRRMLGFTAYSEGWGLYSERLAWEAGFATDPYDNLGRLKDEMMRAVRLVVDTGIHRKRWTREQAIEYMLSKTGMPEADVVSEIERYFVLPGQATAYKVGMIKILALRERAQTALGDAFDIRAFHDVVLGNGDLPLAILERQIDEWIAAQQT